MQNQLAAPVFSQEHIYPALTHGCYMHQSCESRDCSFSVQKQNHTRGCQQGQVAHLQTQCQLLCATFQLSNPHWRSSLSNIQLFPWHLPPVFRTSSTQPSSPSENICAFLSITDGHIFISHHTDLESNFGACSPKSPHLCTWRCCPWLFSWPVPASLEPELQPTQHSN